MELKLQTNPNIDIVCELLQMNVVADIDDGKPTAFWIGTARWKFGPNLFEGNVTPAFATLEELDSFCELHLDEFRGFADSCALPANFPWETAFIPELNIVLSTKTEPPVINDELSDYDQPTPFSPGPYTTDGASVFGRDGRQIGSVDGSHYGPANANLFATSWELFTMLHEYVSTDNCTAHREGETCRFCVSMNVIRRAFGDMDEQVPLLTWFGQFKEQRQIKERFRTEFEKAQLAETKFKAQLQERIFELEAKQERLRDVWPQQANALGTAIAELTVIKYALKG